MEGLDKNVSSVIGMGTHGLAQDRDRWPTLVNAVINTVIP